MNHDLDDVLEMSFYCLDLSAVWRRCGLWNAFSDWWLGGVILDTSYLFRHEKVSLEK